MKQRVLIETAGFPFEAELSDEKSPETFGKVVQNLPIAAEAQIWGEEIYFSVEFGSRAENATTDVNAGDVAFWLEGSAIAIFFGRTPMSMGEKPVPYSACNIIGKLLNLEADKEKLLQVKQGEKITVKASE